VTSGTQTEIAGTAHLRNAHFPRGSRVFGGGVSRISGKPGGRRFSRGGGPPPQKRPIKYCNNCPEISLKGNRYMSKNTCVSAVLTLFSQFRSFFTPMTPKLKSTIGGISPVPVSSSQTRPSSDPKTGTKWHFRATLLVIEKVSDRHLP